MLAMSVFAIKDAIASTVNYKKTPVINAQQHLKNIIEYKEIKKYSLNICLTILNLC